MDNKEQDPALQTPAEANRDKHMNYLASKEDGNNNTTDEENEEIETSKNPHEDRRSKHDADSGNDSTNQMLQKENLVDAGNEHNHLKDTQSRTDDYHSKKNDADAGSDGTGTTGTKPG